MQTTENGFELIMSAVLEQKQIWEKLQAENRELRQQLVDLRAGRGICVEILNQHFELAWAPSKSTSEAAESSQERRPLPAKAVKAAPQSPPLPTSSGVLEEMLLDELSLAIKNRIGAEGKPASPLKEEQMATLRRELSGSFLLE